MPFQLKDVPSIITRNSGNPGGSGGLRSSGDASTDPDYR